MTGFTIQKNDVLRSNKKLKIYRFFKYSAFITSLIMVSPFIIIVRIEELFKSREGILNFVSNSISLIPGFIGSFFRRAFYFGIMKKCSWEMSIGFGSFFAHREAIVGKNVSIGAYSIIGCAEIGDNVLIGSRVSITSGKYQHLDRTSGVSHGVKLETLKIGERSWIGEGAIVMANIGKNCIISAGSVVTKKAPDGVIIVGNPGRFLKRSDFQKGFNEEETDSKH